MAASADAELRRRHPEQPWPPLRSAEPEPTPAHQPEGPATAPETDPDQTARQISELAARHHEFADKLAQRQSLQIPAEDPDYENHGPAFPAWPAPDRNAILQPPKPLIPPSGRILQRTADRDRDIEAAD